MALAHCLRSELRSTGRSSPAMPSHPFARPRSAVIVRSTEYSVLYFSLATCRGRMVMFSCLALCAHLWKLEVVCEHHVSQEILFVTANTLSDARRVPSRVDASIITRYYIIMLLLLLPIVDSSMCLSGCSRDDAGQFP